MNLLAANATGAVTGEWLPWGGVNAAGVERVHFYIDGTHGGATYTLKWRPSGNLGAGMVCSKYTDVSSDIMQSIDVAPGELRVEVTGGSGVNAMPQILF